METDRAQAPALPVAWPRIPPSPRSAPVSDPAGTQASQDTGVSTTFHPVPMGRCPQECLSTPTAQVCGGQFCLHTARGFPPPPRPQVPGLEQSLSSLA